MAAAAADPTATPASKGTSIVVQLGVLVVLTVAAAGIGWFTGDSLGLTASPPKPAVAAGAGHGTDAAAEGGHGEDEEGAANQLVVDLPPITTNLAAPTDVWIRMELAVVYSEPQPPEMAFAVHEDIVAFARTLKLHQIEGASGFLHLKTDIEERAAIRSEGKVKDILFKTLLFE